jgi:ABC-type polysaccharide/polyol phosphate export permease
MATDELQRLAPPPSLSAAPPSRHVTVIEQRRPGLAEALRELWRYRRYTYFFGRRLLARRYMRTWLGVVWLPLRPLMNIAAKLIVFGGLIGISAGKTPYPVYFIAATAAWQLFSESAIWSTRSLDLNRDVLRDLHVPRLVVIVAAVVPSVVDFLINAALAAIGLAYYFIARGDLYLELTPSSIAYVGSALVLIVLLGIGVGLVTAAAGARARDIRFGLMYGLSFVYFLTPVIYTFASIPNRYKPISELNPVTGAMEMFKIGLFHDEGLSPKAVAVTVTAVLLLWLPGLWLFQRNDAREA